MNQVAEQVGIEGGQGPGHLFYPPGGLLVWALVVMELFTFGVALIAFFVSSIRDPEAFQRSRELLNSGIGITNTVVLLTSGYLMALSVVRFKKKSYKAAGRLLDFAVLGGLLFLVFKGFEYHEKISQGYTLGFDTFFTYYWLLTVFHLMHVLVGLVILLVMRVKMTRFKIEDYEGGAVFWHMCDLIWLLLFPALYLFA